MHHPNPHSAIRLGAWHLTFTNTNPREPGQLWLHCCCSPRRPKHEFLCSHAQLRLQMQLAANWRAGGVIETVVRGKSGAIIVARVVVQKDMNLMCLQALSIK